MYGVFDENGSFVGATASISEAEMAAMEVAGAGNEVLALLGDPLPDDVRLNRVPIEQRAEAAFRASGLPQLSVDEVMAWSFEDAFHRFDHIWPTNIAKYQIPDYRVVAIEMFRENEKMKKVRVPGVGEALFGSRGLNLAPHHLVFEAAEAQVPKPAWLAEAKRRSGRRRPTVCAGSVKGCREGCLVATGQNIVGALDSEGRKRTVPMAETYNYQIKFKYTEALYTEPAAFCRLLVGGVEEWLASLSRARTEEKRNARLFLRLNVFSDVPWEIVFPGFFEMFSRVQFYDYTKVAGRRPPPNYHLTYSFNGTDLSAEEAQWEMNVAGRNVAVVFAHQNGRRHLSLLREGYDPIFEQEVFTAAGAPLLPDTFMGAPVISGDLSDLRPLDNLHPFAQGGAQPCIVGLWFKAPKDLEKGGVKGFDVGKIGAFVVEVVEVEGLWVAYASPRSTGVPDPLAETGDLVQIEG